MAVLVSARVAGSSSDDFERAYLGALSTLVQGQRQLAVEALSSAEVRAAGDSSRHGIEDLAEQQFRVARRLAAHSAEHLIPVALLHEQAYIEHLAAERLPLAIHSREMSVRLLEFYLDKARHPDAEAVADLLVSLGGLLQQNSMVSLALALYERSLELSRGNAAALLGLAGAFERDGQYEKALPFLARLLAAHPEHREGRLRLGVNLRRLGEFEDARRILEQIVAGETEDWILSLASQELARMAVAQGELARGRDLLERARARLPQDPSLPTQIAFLEEQQGYSSGSSLLAQALRANAVSGQPSPRALYARVDGEVLAAARTAASQHAKRRLAPLGESLAGLRRDGGQAR